MFSPKKPKISKKDLKKSIVNANDRLKRANTMLEADIGTKRDGLKSIVLDYTACKKALEDTKDMQVLANNELEGSQVEISEIQASIKKALSKLSNLTKKSDSLEKDNKNLEDESDKLVKSIALLEGRKEELDLLTSDIKGAREEAATNQETLELLAIELNQMEAGVESYISRKKAAESEFNDFQEKIGREKHLANKAIKDAESEVAEIKLVSGQEMGRLDKAIAARITELRDMDMLIHKKAFELSTVQSRIGFVEERVRDAEERIECAIKKEQERVGRIKGEFKDWKIEALDEVARMKMKGKIENINKAGLKEVLDG